MAEEEIISEIKQITQKNRLKTDSLTPPPPLTQKEASVLIAKLQERRLEYAHTLLKELNEKEHADRMKKLNQFFRENTRLRRVPSETEIRNIVQNGAEYYFR